MKFFINGVLVLFFSVSMQACNTSSIKDSLNNFNKSVSDFGESLKRKTVHNNSVQNSANSKSSSFVKTSTGASSGYILLDQIDINKYIDVSDDLDLRPYIRGVEIAGIMLGEPASSIKKKFPQQMAKCINSNRKTCTIKREDQKIDVNKRLNLSRLQVEFTYGSVSKINYSQNLGVVNKNTCRSRVKAVTKKLKGKYGDYFEGAYGYFGIIFYPDVYESSGLVDAKRKQLYMYARFHCEETLRLQLEAVTNLQKLLIAKVAREKDGLKKENQLKEIQRKNPEREASF